MAQPTRTTAETRAFLLQEIGVFDREVFQPYKPSMSDGDWRPFNLKMESWLPQHPDFAQFYYWNYEKYVQGLFWYTFFTPRAMSSRVDEYLAQRR